MKKISQIIAYSLLGVVVLAFVLTATIKKDFAPNIIVPTYESKGIEIKQAGLAKYDGLGDNDNYNKFVKEYNSSFKLTILYSIFSGEISRTQAVTNIGKTAPSIDSGYVVTFNYPENQVLKSNGKVYYESTNSDTKTLYKKVFFVVENGKGLVSKNIYFYSEANSSYYKLTTLANFDNLYNFIVELPMFAEQE